MLEEGIDLVPKALGWHKVEPRVRSKPWPRSRLRKTFYAMQICIWLVHAAQMQSATEGRN